MFDKILDYIFTPQINTPPKGVNLIRKKYESPVPEGYTTTIPDKSCQTCILYDNCPNYEANIKRFAFPVIWDGGGMLLVYPIDYPDCKYHTTVDDVIEWRGNQ